MPFYDKGDIRIRYEEAGSGFPLLVTPGGGLNSRVSNWDQRAHLRRNIRLCVTPCPTISCMAIKKRADSACLI